MDAPPLELIQSVVDSFPPPHSFHRTDIYQLRKAIVFITLLLSGIRCQELCNLTHADVVTSFQTQSLTFRLHTLKNGADRIILCKSDRVLTYFNHYRWLTNPAPSFPWVYVPHNAKPYPRLIHRIITGLMPGYSPHSLRHNFAITLLRSGVDVSTVQYLMGHRRLSSTAVYLRPLAAELAQEKIATVFNLHNLSDFK